MVETFREAQLPLLAFVLMAACLTKLTVREPVDTVDPGTMTATLLRHRPAVVVLALVEGALGIGLLVSDHPVARFGTVVVFFVATSVVFELRARKADEGCGCFGGLSATPVRLRAVVRAFLFLLAGLAAVGLPVTGFDVIRHATGWHGLVVAIEIGVFAALSPEIGVLLARRRERIPCEQRTVPLSESFAILHASEQWREHVPLVVTADPVDVWRELCWRFLVYGGRQDDEEVEIVFAVSTEERNPVVKVAIVRPDDDDSDTGPNHMYALSV